MPDPKTSGTGYAFYLNVVNIMGEDNAIEYFKKLKNNLREFTTSGSGPTNLLKQGEIAIAMGMTAQGVEAINNGFSSVMIDASKYDLETNIKMTKEVVEYAKKYDKKNNICCKY